MVLTGKQTLLGSAATWQSWLPFIEEITAVVSVFSPSADVPGVTIGMD